MSTLLGLTGVARHFGSLRAVDGVSFAVARGGRHAVIGPNGAGKSTLFNLIGGSLRVTSGSVAFAGTEISRMPEYRRARLGIARTFQHSSVFLGESAVENVLLGVARKSGVGGRFVRPALRHRALVERCVALLDEVGLTGRYDTPAGNLSHGERRQLEIAMALGTEPSLLLLDEPAAGMSGAETGRFTELIAGLPREVTVLLIEHDLDVVFELADTVTVLHLGQHLATGTPEEIRGNAEVQQAYLGAADFEDLFGGTPIDRPSIGGTP
ncbi:MAG: ABC transporter ATP-binding protein [Micromonosporaceae bacterium]